MADIRDAAYYDLVGRSLAGISYQEFVDTVFADKYNAPDTSGFVWDEEIQMDFTYHQLQAELGIYAMATYVDLDSPAPLRSVDGIEINTGKIPRMKHGFKLNEKIIREQMIMAGKGAFDAAAEKAIMTVLYNSTDKLIGGNYNTLKYQRHQIVSTGKFTLLNTNNPQGLQNVTFDFKVPPGNITTKTSTARWWTDDAYTTEGSASDPVADLVALVKAAEDAYAPVGVIEVSQKCFTRFLGHSKVRIALGYYYNPEAASDTIASNIAKRLSKEESRVLLERKLGYPIHIIDSVSEVESYDKATKSIVKTRLSSFDEDAWVLMPDGEIGTIKSVQPIIIPDPAARIALYDGGRTVLTQTFDAKNKYQYIESELTALCVPNRTKYMYYLNIK
jgi:hypothetical protein